MLHDRSHITNAIKKLAVALGDLNEQVVYVGGAVVGLYADDSGAAGVRPTKDIDIIVEIASASELESLRQKLDERGIRFVRDEKVMCRFQYQDIIVDIMATKETGWAPANRWFKDGFALSQTYNLDDYPIKIMPLAYFLATKFTAFDSRGDDPRISPDFEDIVYILDNCSTLIKDILESDDIVKLFLIDKFSNILSSNLFQEAVLAHLEPATQTERFDSLMNKLKEMRQ